MFKNQRYLDYSAAGFRKDLIAGITVGIVAIPLGMAFAIASGVKPEYGLYTTIIAGLIVALMGGSRFQIAGPTGAFIPILLAIVLQYGYEDLLIAGFLAGIFLVIMAFLGVSNLIHFVPRSVTIGFTAGIAVIIFTGQFQNFFGLTGVEKKEFFHESMIQIAQNFHTVNMFSILTALIGLAVIFTLPKFAPRVPVLLVALLIPTVFSILFFSGRVETIGTAYGGIPQHLPSFHFPEITMAKLMNLWKPALIIAALGAIESLLSAVVADGMKSDVPKHDSKKELFGQGIANMITPLFGGIPATGAIARTATNIGSGAVSPISGVVQSLFVLAFLLLFAPYASYIPLAAMAPILMFVAWNMSSRVAFAQIASLRSGDSLVLLTTFFLTIFVNLTVAVEVGILLAALSFLRKMSGSLDIKQSKLTDVEKFKLAVESETELIKFKVSGPLFFGTAKTFEDRFPDLLKLDQQTIILDMQNITAIDATGEAALSSLLDEARQLDKRLVFKRVPQEKVRLFKRSGLYDKIGEDNFFMQE